MKNFDGDEFVTFNNARAGDDDDEVLIENDDCEFKGGPFRIIAHMPLPEPAPAKEV